MVTIKPDRCGYTGYICNNVPDLYDVFNTTHIVGDSTIDNTDMPENVTVTRDAKGNVVSITHIIDNYLDIPAKFTGFVSSVPLIYSLGHLAANVSGCTVIGEPFDAVSKIDKLMAWKDKNHTAAVDIKNDELLIYDNNQLSSPGILDVMVNPLPPPVSPNNIPDFDMALDGIIFALYNMLKWQDLTNSRLAQLEQKKISTKNYSGYISGLQNVMLASNMTTTCTNFHITWRSGPVLTTRLKKQNTYYDVSDGTVYYGNEEIPIYVEKKEKIEAPFDVSLYLYKNLEEPNNINKYYCKIDLSNKKEALEAKGCLQELYIGGVDLVDTNEDISTETGFKKVDITYKMYKIIQAECIVYIDSGSSGGGIVYGP